MHLSPLLPYLLPFIHPLEQLDGSFTIAVPVVFLEVEHFDVAALDQLRGLLVLHAQVDSQHLVEQVHEVLIWNTLRTMGGYATQFSMHNSRILLGTQPVHV
jgi:hypothetical protein